MPTGSKGEKRPADVIGNAVRVMRIATDKDDEATTVYDGKDPAAVSMGTRGGAARAKVMTPEIPAKKRGPIRSASAKQE